MPPPLLIFAEIRADLAVSLLRLLSSAGGQFDHDGFKFQLDGLALLIAFLGGSAIVASIRRPIFALHLGGDGPLLGLRLAIEALVVPGEPTSPAPA